MSDAAVVRSWAMVAEWVEQQILAGTLGVGDRLPAERDLAAQLKVSRPAVREAIRSLEAQGVVRSAVGSGKDAGTTVSAMSSPALSRLLRLHVALTSFSMADVVEARVMLERSSASLAAGHRDPDHLDAVRAALVAMDAPGLDRQQFNDLDTAFHVAIAEAGGNRLVADMTIGIRESMRGPILRALEHLGDGWESAAERFQGDHRAVFAAIEGGDAAAAATLVEQHIRDALGALSLGRRG